MKKKYVVVSLPKEPTRHHLGNFGLVEIKEDLPSEICEAGFKAGLTYFAEVPVVEAVPVVETAPVVEAVPVVEAAPVAETEEVKEEKKATKK